MLQEKIYKLYLSKSKMVFKDEFGTPLNFDEEIGDYSVPIIHNDNYCPDFYITGFLRKVNNGMSFEFIISRKGPQILFITGIPNSSSNVTIYKFKNTLFTSYYKDDVKGCLFQVLNKNITYQGISKSLGIKQFNHF